MHIVALIKQVLLSLKNIKLRKKSFILFDNSTIKNLKDQCDALQKMLLTWS